MSCVGPSRLPHGPTQPSTDIDGMVLRSGDRSEDIIVSGYKDDTAIYLRGSDGIPQILTILETFVRVSGLAINRSKSIVLVLGPYDPSRRVDSYGLILLSPNEHCIYLGIQEDKVIRRIQIGIAVFELCTTVSFWPVRRLILWSNMLV